MTCAQSTRSDVEASSTIVIVTAAAPKARDEVWWPPHDPAGGPSSRCLTEPCRRLMGRAAVR